MCRQEGASLQQGMNFGIGGNHSVILMSVRRNAPYRDRLEDGGTTLVYEGHDQPKGPNSQIPELSISHSDSLQVGLHRMGNSTRLLNCTNWASTTLSAYACTRKSRQEFGRIMASFIWLILGESAMNTVRYSSIASLPSRETTALTVHRGGMFSGAE